MVIERCANEFVIRMPVISQIERLQELVDYFRYIELTSGHNIPQNDVDVLAREINKKWRTEYEDRS
ncbi:MAG: hypothetical protein LBU70_09755 [Chitinispirillales bacterium]|nr:hypothetical protein [Chitinispirillales bacterium]